ncbi:alcohol dehydrogenase catalytic domain-containing protein [uncultured Pseudacidovorax sp.]|uniref:alcohol dehydrogenase catalytic domain-containing protein n=1 Tax=uncultured Pseudacidovorax sp. TaxID=679313 RepID=UPI0025E99D4F|nr:alcohol dehydrogenase catalytic domain-containing protein [uncultured Pseudacidovorax sp.]
MRAAVQFQPEAPLEVVDGVEIDDPVRGEVLVRVTHCGVCQSDLGIAAGKLPYPFPVILGHEAAGQVAAVGEGIEDLKVGDRVVLSMKAPCGSCGSCLYGQPVMCDRSGGPLSPQDRAAALPRVRWQGKPITRGLRLGAFAEFVLAERSGVVPVPEALPSSQACLVGCAVQTGLGSVLNIAQVKAGERAAVIGTGAVGLSLIGALRLAGAREIVGVEVHAQRRDSATLFGATQVLDPAAPDFEATVARLVARTGGLEHVFDAVGNTHTLASASRLVRKGGAITLVGVPPVGVPLAVPALDIVMRQLTVRGSFLGNSHPQRDLPRYLDLCCGGRFDLGPLVTRLRPLDEINEAFEDLRQGAGIRTVLTL